MRSIQETIKSFRNWQESIEDPDCSRLPMFEDGTSRQQDWACSIRSEAIHNFIGWAECCPDNFPYSPEEFRKTLALSLNKSALFWINLKNAKKTAFDDLVKIATK
jgi:hypothetical protein